jgi:hypothetical protein
MKKYLKGCLALAGLALCAWALFVPASNIITFGWLVQSALSGSIGATALLIAKPWNDDGRRDKFV